MSKKTQRAGVVPFYVLDDGGFKMMFMKPSDKKYGGEEFQLAKGKVDEGENPLEAGLREANEELGLRESNVKWLEKVGVFLVTHHIYIVEVSSMNDSEFDEVTFETGAVSWMTEGEFISDGRTLHIPIIKKCAAQFRKHG